MAKKQDTEKPRNKMFKKIFFSAWTWIIIALISYFIFASIPIRWDESGYGWDNSVGSNLCKTIFAYITVFALIFAINLIIFAIIKRIQRSSIGDYWKISLTIIGIIIMITFTFFAVGQYMPSGSDEKDFDLYKIHENVSRGFLTENGYEVLSLHYGSYSTDIAIQNGFTKVSSCYAYQGQKTDLANGTCWSNYTQAYVKMKSLGNLNDQLWDALIALSSFRPVSMYRIDILAPTETCTYYLTGKTYDSYLDVDLTDNYSETNINLTRSMAQKVNVELEKYKNCY